MLLDTSGLYCYFDNDDQWHKQAVEYFDAPDAMVVSDYILAKLIPLCYVRGLSRTKTLDLVEELLASPLIKKVWTTESNYLEALDILKLRQDKTYSLCDAASFILMRERGITGSLTTDKHFEQEGFVRLPK